MAATRGKKIPGTNATVSQRPKSGKGVFPPAGTPDVEGDLYGLLDFLLGPFMGGGESVHPIGAPDTGVVDPRAQPAPQGGAQPALPSGYGVDSLPAQNMPQGGQGGFDAASVFGDAFQGGRFNSPPMPAKAPGFAPQMPAPNPFPGMHQAAGIPAAVPPPEMNPALHNEERIKQMIGALIGGQTSGV